jgi:methyl-accepting chemotaxis protein
MKTIKAKFLLSSTLLLISTIALGTVGILATHSLTTDMARNEIAALALENHINGDMMHDALRGDVMAAILFSGNSERSKKVADSMLEHAGTFTNMIEANKKLDLPGDIKEALASLQDPLTDYIASTKSQVKLAQENREVALTSLPEFEKKFEKMEAAQAVVFDKVSAFVASSDKEGSGVSSLYNKITLGLAAACAIQVLLTMAFGIAFVVHPMTQVTEDVERLSKGDKGFDIRHKSRRDELGSIAKALQGFKENLIASDKLRDDQENIKRQNEQANKQAMRALADNFENRAGSVINSIGSAATELQSTAESMMQMAEDTSRKSGAVAAASEQATTNVQTVSAATEELSASINEIQSLVQKSTQIINNAVLQTNQTNERVQKLAEAAHKIGSVVNIISDIAAQTNLLALNATIEAARAGEAGKGFAVVASEVKSLAGQTAKATEEITMQINHIQKETLSSAEAIKGITESISNVSQTSVDIFSAVEKQGAATQEIARNVSEAAQGTQEVSGNIVEVNDSAQRTGESASQVLSAAGELARNGEFLKTQVTDFLSDVRGA